MEQILQIGNRYKNLEDLKVDLEKLHNCKVINIFESESERFEDTDFMIDYELENDSNVYTIFYLFDNGHNYYITEF